MKKLLPRLLATVALAAALHGASSPAQAPIAIKIATIAPKGTSPHLALMAMADKWQKASNNLKVTVYADGLQGGEAASLQRIRARQIHGSLLTVVGLSEIEPSSSALQNIPMMFRTLDEVDYVQQKLVPEMEQKFLKKNYVVLGWCDVGWVRFFSKAPLARPAELKGMKLFTWVGDPYQSGIMKAAGYNPVPLETNDIQASLQTGLINAVPMPPLVAEAGQIDKTASNMLELNWAPLVGAIVLDKATWDAFPKPQQDIMRQAAVHAANEIRQKGRSESERAVAAMQKRGLKLQKTTPEIEAQWQKTAEEVYPKIRGTIVPADMFDRVNSLVQEYRSSKR